jgi:hypothetical protein
MEREIMSERYLVKIEEYGSEIHLEILLRGRGCPLDVGNAVEEVKKGEPSLKQ